MTIREDMIIDDYMDEEECCDASHQHDDDFLDTMLSASNFQMSAAIELTKLAIADKSCSMEEVFKAFEKANQVVQSHYVFNHIMSETND